MWSFGFYNETYFLFSLCFEIELMMVFKIHSASLSLACELFIPNTDFQIWPDPNKNGFQQNLSVPGFLFIAKLLQLGISGSFFSGAWV